MGRPWSQRDLKVLRNSYGKLSVDKLQELLDVPRSKPTIYSKASRLGLTKKQKKPSEWTKQEINFLKTNHKKLSNSELSVSLGKTEASIAYKKKILNLKRYQKKEKFWSKSDILYLKKNVGKKTVRQIATYLKRTEPSVKSKCYSLGFRTASRLFSWKDLDLLLNFDGERITPWRFRQWKEYGFRTKSIYKNQWSLTDLKELKAFLRKRPEAVDIYSLPSNSLEELKIDLESWPEPPVYKIIKCEGLGQGAHKPHEVYRNYFFLYKENNHCKKCGLTLGYWATDGYSNEHPE